MWLVSLFALFGPGVLLTSLVWLMLVAVSSPARGNSTSLSIASFAWADAPLSGPEAPILGAALYLAVVFSLWAYVRQAPARSVEGKLAINAVQVFHNLVLAAWSLIMCVGCAGCVVARLKVAAWGYDWFFCELADAEVTADAEGAAVIRSLYFWAYCYYISKFYEFLDTILQLLKSGTVHSPWLHIFHHAVVPIMSWLWLEKRQSLMFGGLIFNTFVHIPMYIYYAQTSYQAYAALRRGTSTPAKPKWGSWVTSTQILQFATSFGLLAITVTKYLLAGHSCAGMDALAFNSVFNLILLVLFVGLSRQKRDERKQKKDVGTGKKDA